MRIVLDACVLYPTLLRQILMGCVGQGLFAPVWSDRIMEEWRRAVLRDRPEDAAIVAAEIADLTTRAPSARVTAAPEVEGRVSLPDPQDAHVLATAITGAAAAIVTLNLKDFPRTALAPHGVSVFHPDAFLCGLHAEAPGQVATAVATALDPLPGDRPPRHWLRKAYLSRLGRTLG